MNSTSSPYYKRFRLVSWRRSSLLTISETLLSIDNLEAAATLHAQRAATYMMKQPIHFSMASTPTPYIKSLDDELDWKLIDQLYGVVSQISGFCFETKKFCVTTEFVVLAFLAKFTANKPDHSIFVAGLAIPLCFWFLDSVAYFYQVKIRGTMNSIRERIKERNKQQIVDPGGEPVIARNRTQRGLFRRIFDAGVNSSMFLYGFLIVIDLITWKLFVFGAIA